jgi:hypothetical protein
LYSESLTQKYSKDFQDRIGRQNNPRWEGLDRISENVVTCGQQFQGCSIYEN